MRENLRHGFLENRLDIGEQKEPDKPPYPKGFEPLSDIVSEANTRIAAYDAAIDSAKPKTLTPGLHPPDWLKVDRRTSSITTWIIQREQIKQEALAKIEAITSKGDATLASAAKERAMAELAPEPDKDQEAPGLKKDAPDAEISASQERMLDLLSPENLDSKTRPPDIEPEID